MMSSHFCRFTILFLVFISAQLASYIFHSINSNNGTARSATAKKILTPLTLTTVICVLHTFYWDCKHRNWEISNQTNLSNFYPHEVVGRGREKELNLI